MDKQKDSLKCILLDSVRSREREEKEFLHSSKTQTRGILSFNTSMNVSRTQ